MCQYGLRPRLSFFLFFLNGLLALSELAIVSARKSRLEQLAKQGDSRARLALKLANSPDSFLSTIQIGITFVGILTGAFGGATIAELLARYLDGSRGCAFGRTPFRMERPQMGSR